MEYIAIPLTVLCMLVGAAFLHHGWPNITINRHYHIKKEQNEKDHSECNCSKNKKN